MSRPRRVQPAIPVLLALISIAPASLAGPPERIGFQGRLTDGSGNPLEGTHTLTFTLYDESDGIVWTETHANVPVNGGLYGLELGGVAPLSIPFDAAYTLGVKVDADEEMTPRYALLAAPYAMRAKTAASADLLGGVPAGGFALSTHAHDHGALTGLADDDHAQYALLAGRPGGQSLTGGTATGNTLTLTANTADPQPAYLHLSAAGRYAGIGTTAPERTLDVWFVTGQGHNGIGLKNTDGAGRHYAIDVADALGNPGDATGLPPFAFGIVDLTAGLTRLVISQEGHVGIGTRTPSAPLDVAGAGRFTGTVSGADPCADSDFVTRGYAGLTYAPVVGGSYVAKSGDTMTGALVLPPDGLVAGTTQLVLSGGRVGVGTATPASSLEVVGAQETYGTAELLRLRSGATANASLLRISGRTGFDATSCFASLQSQAGSGGASWLNLNPDGGLVTVGVLNNGGRKLEVYGGAVFRGDGMGSEAALDVGTGVLTGERSLYLHTGANSMDNTGAVGIFFGQFNLYDMAAIKAVNEGGAPMNRTAGLSFWTEPPGTGVPLVERMRITGTGRVGIGTTAPGTALDVAGTIRTNAQLVSTVADGTAPLAVVSTTAVANLNADLLDGHHASSFAASTSVWNLSGNAGTTPGTHFLGTTDDQALELKVSGARALRLEPRATSPNIVGGHAGNALSAATSGAVIAGGGSAANPHQMTGDPTYGFIGGGEGNRITGGGWGTIGGGYGNTVSLNAGTVCGGYGNTAGGDSAVVGGGNGNTANGALAAVPGGNLNSASGDLSLAAGYRAKANHRGTFVWGDGQNADFVSTAPNQYLVRAAGGVGINTNAPATALDVNGQVKIQGGSPGIGKVLSSDASGLASWSKLADLGTALGTGTQNYMTKWTNTNLIGNSLLYDNGTNVGLGTSSPAYPLHVVRSMNGESMTAMVENLGSFSAAGYRMKTPAAGNDWSVAAHETGSGAADGFKLFHNSSGSQVLVIKAGTLYLGLGVASPVCKLDVSGSIRAGDVDTWKAMMGRHPSYGGAMACWWMEGRDYSLMADGTHTFLNSTSGGHLYLRTGNADRMIVQNSGNVGIGTTSPAQKLDINGTARAADFLSTVFGSAATQDVALRSPNVGTGSGNGGSVALRGGDAGSGSGGAGGNITLQAGGNMPLGGSGYTNLGPAGAVSIAGGYGYNSVGGDVRLQSGPTSTWALGDPHSSVEILGGPSDLGGDGASVTVQGATTHGWGSDSPNPTTGGSVVISAGIGALGGAAGSIQLLNGNVGIGTTAPSTTLDVAGSAKVSGSLGVGGGTSAIGFVDSASFGAGSLAPGPNVFSVPFAQPGDTIHVGVTPSSTPIPQAIAWSGYCGTAGQVFVNVTGTAGFAYNALRITVVRILP